MLGPAGVSLCPIERSDRATTRRVIEASLVNWTILSRHCGAWASATLVTANSGAELVVRRRPVTTTRGKVMKVYLLLLAAALALSTVASAMNEGAVQSTATSATFVSAAEINAAAKKYNSGAFSDYPIRVVPIESKYNVGVAVVRRSKIDGRMLPDALIHNDVTEVYQIIEGEGVLVTGGTLQSAKPLTAAAIVGEIGPSSAGQSIVGGASRRVAPGDIVIIPPHTPHGFVDITTPRIVYTIIRIDPQKLLELRSKPK